jgi:hypothetical protein
MTVATPMLAAMEACLAGVDDMAALSARVFARFLSEYPEEAARFINVDAAVLRMTDETFVLLHGLASGADWAAGSAAHWADLHRNYGAINNASYARWTALCLAEMEVASGTAWAPAAPGWIASAAQLTALLAAANGSH